MNKSNTTLASKKGMSTLARPKFAPGMLLQHEDLEQLTYYTRDLSRLMFRSLFGCGVMCGLVVTTDRDCGKARITIGAGVALSCSGDPIEVPSDVSVLIDRECHPDFGETLWVTLCGTTKCCAPRTSMCEGDDDETQSECTRERDGYEVRVETARPACVCGCPEPDVDAGKNQPGVVENQITATDPARRTTEDATPTDCMCVDVDKYPCYKNHYAGLCGCHCDDCSDCNCKCVLLARLDYDADNDTWTSDHSVRRFVRPVLMRDPQVAKEVEEREKPEPPEPGKPVPPPPPPPPPPPAPVPQSPPKEAAPQETAAASTAAVTPSKAARTRRRRTTSSTS